MPQGAMAAAALAVNSSLNRWGRNVTPVWVNGIEHTAPGAGTALVTQAVTAGKTGYIYGFEISAEEANDFILSWTSSTAVISMRYVFGGAGSIHLDSFIAVNDGWGADAASTITITNVTAGGIGRIYQARLLYGEL